MAGKIVPIVEGDGEVTAVPVLLHRLLRDSNELGLQIAAPKNAHGSGNLTKDGGVERFVRYAWIEPGCAAVIIIIDGDAADCAMTLGKSLAERIRKLRGPKPVAVVVANREYEAWFLASLPSMAGKQIAEALTLPEHLLLNVHPEKMRNVKGWITRQLPSGKSYKETEHQASMTRLIDLGLARASSRSFRRIYNAIAQLSKAISENSTAVTP